MKTSFSGLLHREAFRVTSIMRRYLGFCDFWQDSRCIYLCELITSVGLLASTAKAGKRHYTAAPTNHVGSPSYFAMRWLLARPIELTLQD